jgi:hypothetical protein
MALMAIPPRHGRATQVVNNSLKCVVRVMLSGVFDVWSLCREGDCTYTARRTLSMSTVRSVMGGLYSYRVPGQGWTRVSAGKRVPETAAAACFDVDPGGKSARCAFARGDVWAVFAENVVWDACSW